MCFWEAAGGESSAGSMISIKRLLESRSAGPSADDAVINALMQMPRMLLDAMASHSVRVNEEDFFAHRRLISGLAQRLDEQHSAADLLEIAGEAVEAEESYSRRAADYLRAQSEERQSIVSMLAETVADLAGKSDAAVARLQAVEKQIERASALDDIRSLRASLAASLRALRDAAAEERSSARVTIERMRGQIALAQAWAPCSTDPARNIGDELDLIPESSDDPVEKRTPPSYIAVFRLQREAHIVLRYGEDVRRRMLTMIAAQLKTALGPGDRLMRWKGTCFVMLINSPAPLPAIRARLAGAVGKTSQQYLQVGSKSVLLSVGVDWAVFSQADRPSLEGVYNEIDAFLTRRPALAASLPK